MSTPSEATPTRFASIDDISVSWHLYERFLARLTCAPAPDGLALQLAGPTDEGVRVVGVWETEQDFERFRIDRLGPAIEALAGPVAPVWATRRLRVVHVVLGMASPAVTRRSTAHVQP